MLPIRTELNREEWMDGDDHTTTSYRKLRRYCAGLIPKSDRYVRMFIQFSNSMK